MISKALSQGICENQMSCDENSYIVKNCLRDMFKKYSHVLKCGSSNDVVC